jgi:hypothetical protein
MCKINLIATIFVFAATLFNIYLTYRQTIITTKHLHTKILYERKILVYTEIGEALGILTAAIFDDIVNYLKDKRKLIEIENNLSNIKTILYKNSAIIPVRVFEAVTDFVDMCFDMQMKDAVMITYENKSKYFSALYKILDMMKEDIATNEVAEEFSKFFQKRLSSYKNRAS